MNYERNKVERWKRHKQEILRTNRETNLEKQDRGRKGIQRHKVTKQKNAGSVARQSREKKYNMKKKRV